MLPTINENSFNEQVKTAKGIVLVNFWASWSEECRRMRSVMQKVEHLVDEDHAIIHIDWDQQKQLARELEVFGVPTLLIYIKGRELARYSGTVDKLDLVKRITEAKKRFIGAREDPVLPISKRVIRLPS
jgi:thioredoxin 1